MHLPFISSSFHYFKVFYGYAGKKLYYLCIIIFFGGLSEGLGISMLFPVLNFESKTETTNAYSQTVYSFLESVGIGVSLFSLLGLLFAVFFLKGIFYFSQASLTSYICTDLAKNLRIGFSKKYAAMNYSYYTNANIGYLNNVVTVEIDKAVSGLQAYIRIIVAIVFIFVYVTSAFIINWKITFLVLGISLAMFFVLRKLSAILRRMSVLVTETNAHIQSLLIQLIYNFKYLKATDNFTHLVKTLEKKINKNRHYNFKSNVLQAIPSSIVEPVTILFLSGIMFYHVSYLRQSISEVMILAVFFYRTFTRVFDIQGVWQKFNSYYGSIEVVNKTTKDLHIHQETLGSRRLNHFEKEIFLKGANFDYEGTQVLFDINLIVPKNRYIGIVGESGAGKTTLLDIITGLIIPKSGKVFIDGISYKELNLLSLRKIVGYVTQEPVIFNDTIANNISLWECNMQDLHCRKRIENAAVLANCDRFINEAEMGYDTVLGDKGVKLSGGQRQRIAIARELFKEPEIMIFDEATSALDTESEMLIQKSISSLKGERTIVIIAHRLSTVKNCDYIYVLKEGRIVEEGSFDELYRDTNSRFYSMCLAQNL
jgi:subfamily B ATP-binding cassette protein MsbA